MKIALTYNLKKEDSTKPQDYASEFDSEETINAISAALQSCGHKVQLVEASQPRLLSVLKESRADMVFNIAEGERGRYRESEIPAMLDFLNIPYTGSGALALAVALNKALTKKILIADNIPTPRFQLFTTGREKLDPGLKFPLIVKPNFEGSAKGINRSNVVTDKDSFYAKAKELIDLYKQDALVEEFIEGKELTVGILENGTCSVQPILEIDFDSAKRSGEFFYSWRMKEFQGDDKQGLTPTFHCPARLDKATEKLVKDTALRTHRAVGCYDISRTDFRLSKNNLPYVLEINPLPGLNPKGSNFPIMAYAAGMKYEDIINTILTSAYKRRKVQNG